MPRVDAQNGHMTVKRAAISSSPVDQLYFLCFLSLRPFKETWNSVIPKATGERRKTNLHAIFHHIWDFTNGRKQNDLFEADLLFHGTLRKKKKDSHLSCESMFSYSFKFSWFIYLNSCFVLCHIVLFPIRLHTFIFKYQINLFKEDILNSC